MKRLLIIGAGYVGGELAQQAQVRGWQVYSATKSGDVGTEQVDVSCQQSVAALYDRIGRVNAIVHCASSGRGGVEAYKAVFLEGVQNLIRTFRETPLVFTSSTSVYAQINGETVTEESVTIPTRETGELLLATEKYVLDHKGIVARLAGIYGPGRSMVIKKLMNKTAYIELEGEKFVNQIHRDDAASALLFLVEKSVEGECVQEIFNVADSHPILQIDLYKGVTRLFEMELPPTGPRNLNSKRGWSHKAVSNAKLKSAGWSPKYDTFLDVALEIRETLSLK